MLLKFAANINN